MRRGLLISVTLVLAAVAAPLGPAAASPQEVINDWANDGAIDGTYSITDLQNAPRLLQRQVPTDVPKLVAAVDVKIDKDFLGITPSGGATTTPSVPSPDLPLWALVGSVGAGLLALSGVASALILRTRQRR